MSYVVGEPCTGCKYGDCVDVCPVNCFYQDEQRLYINPAECIDCDACVPACPVDAIFPEDQAPAYPREGREHVAPYYIWLAERFPYDEDSRVITSDEVEPGPDWDPELAG